MSVLNFFQIVLGLTKKAIMKLVAEHRTRSKKIHDDTSLPSNFQTHNDNIDALCDQIETKDAQIKQTIIDLKNERADQRANKKTLIEMLKRQKSQLEGHWNFDEKELSKYGFVVKPQGQGEPIYTMPKVENVQLTYGDHPASLDAHWNPVEGYHYYKTQICYLDPAVEANWKDSDSADVSSHTFENLERGKLCWIRVAVVGAEDTGPWSDAVSKMVP